MHCDPCAKRAKGYGKSVSFRSGTLTVAGGPTHTFRFDCSNIGSEHFNKGWLIDLGYVSSGGINQMNATATITMRNLHREFAPVRLLREVVIPAFETTRIFLPYPNIEIQVRVGDGGGVGNAEVFAAGAFYDLRDFPIPMAKRYMYRFDQITLDPGGNGATLVPEGATAFRAAASVSTNGPALLQYNAFAPTPVYEYTLDPDTPNAYATWYDIEETPVQTIDLTGGVPGDVWTIGFRYDLWS